jgi:hypothetical protein
MSKRYGDVKGNDDIVFTGTDFVAPTALRFLTESSFTATVHIDGKPCTVSDQTSTTVTCNTSNKPDAEDDPTLVITIEGMGNVATQG